MTSPADLSAQPTPLTDVAQHSLDAARFTGGEDAGGIDPTVLGEQLDAVGRDKSLASHERRAKALEIFKAADKAAIDQARARLGAGTPGLMWHADCQPRAM